MSKLRGTVMVGNDLSHSASHRWLVVAGVVFFAALLRVICYSGFFGSDEVTYTASAFKLLHGDWVVSSYVGANRYGVNLPVAAFALVFGQNEFSAAIYSLLCSLGEVALVTYFGSRMLGPRAGLLAGLLLASLPIHVHFAGRLMADAPLGLAITASLLLFYDGETRRRNLSYVLAGCAAGLSFWIKPVAIIYLGVFLVYPIFVRRFDLRWSWMLMGFAATVLANNVLLWQLTGDFWFVVQNHIDRRATGNAAAAMAAGTLQNEPFYYLAYLFGKVYHTWMVGPLALGGIVLWWRWRGSQPPDGGYGMRFTLWWAIGLLLILSVLIVGLSPFRLVPKQTNYMLIFVAPLCLLGGYALSRVEGRVFWWLASLAVVPALIFAALLQSLVQVFTANSKATLQFARERPDAVVYATTNAHRAGMFYALVRPQAQQIEVRSIDEVAGAKSLDASHPAASKRYAVVDTETLAWSADEPFRRLQDVPKCWVPVGTLTAEPQGAGVMFLRLLENSLRAIPVVGESALTARVARLTNPLPAHVYELPGSKC